MQKKNFIKRRLDVGRSFTDCTPVKGTYKGSDEHTLEVSVEIKNGSAKKTAEKYSQPKFSYEAKNPGEPTHICCHNISAFFYIKSLYHLSYM